MPHQCTNCGHTFPDGSKEMLSGCPDCGGNKFQFKPASQQSGDQQSDPSSSDPSSTEPPAADSQTSEPSASTADTPKSPPETKGVGDDSGFVSKDLENPEESPAQSTARSEVVSSSEITAAGSTGPQSDDTSQADDKPQADNSSQADTGETQPAQSAESTPDASHTAGEESNLDQLRKELNNQFESIRILSPGQYELNLMELYDREEYIISLREDGRYVIEVPDGWGDT